MGGQEAPVRQRRHRRQLGGRHDPGAHGRALAGQERQAQGGRPLPPGQGQLRRRHQPAEHAAHVDPAQPGGPRPDQLDRHLGRRGPRRGGGGGHRRAAGPAQPGLDADLVRRHPGRAGHRQGAHAGPGGRLRDRRGPLCRPRRPGADRGRLRPAAGGDHPPAEPGAGRPGDPGRQGRQAGQPRLPLGGGRQGRHRPGLRQGRPGGHLRDLLPPLPPGPDGDLRLRGRRQPGHRQGHHLHDLPGPARPPDGVRAGHRPARAPDPDHLARHRRRLRQQGAHLPRLRGRHRGLAAARAAGQVDRGPHRQPDLDRVRPRLLHEGRAGPGRRRQDARPAGQHAVRPGLRLRRRPAEQAQGRSVPHRHRLLRHPRGPRGHRRGLHQQGPRRGRLPLLVPGHRGLVLHRAPRPDGRLRARGRPGRAAPQELHPARAVPLYLGHRLRVRLGRLRDGHGQGPGDARLRGPQGRAGPGPRRGQAARDRGGHLHRGGRGRAEQGLRHPRPEDVRLGRAAGPPDRQGDPQDRRPDPGPGPRDDLRPDRGPRARHPALGHPGPARRHRQHPLRAGHLRLAEHPDGRGGHGHGLAQAARQGQAAGRPPAGGRPRGPGVGRRPVPGPGRPRPPDHHPGGRLRRLHQPPPGDGGRAWRASPTTTRPT